MDEDRGPLGYFALAREPASAWAALVVVTEEGDPVDFLYTDPVTLSRLTHRLLGPRLDSYLAGRLLLEPLLEQAGGRLSVLCFDEPAVLRRRFGFGLPAAVVAPAESAHKHGAWIHENVPDGNGGAHALWVTAEKCEAAVSALSRAAAAMAPFGLLEPFQQLRAAMAEVRGEKG